MHAIPFHYIALFLAIVLAALAFLLGIATQIKPQACRKLPRERIVGVIIGITALAWAASQAMLMLEGDLEKLRPIIQALVPLTAFLSFFYLSYLFTRAVSGLMLLAITLALHKAFVADVPLRPLYSLICYLLAFAAMVLIAQPWLFRNCIDKAIVSPRFRRWATSVVTGGALVFLAFGLATWL